jgi:hypothetical protein
MRLQWITALDYACATTHDHVEERPESPPQLLYDFKDWRHD